MSNQIAFGRSSPENALNGLATPTSSVAAVLQLLLAAPTFGIAVHVPVAVAVTVFVLWLISFAAQLLFASQPKQLSDAVSLWKLREPRRGGNPLGGLATRTAPTPCSFALPDTTAPKHPSTPSPLPSATSDNLHLQSLRLRPKFRSPGLGKSCSC